LTYLKQKSDEQRVPAHTHTHTQHFRKTIQATFRSSFDSLLRHIFLIVINTTTYYY